MDDADVIGFEYQSGYCDPYLTTNAYAKRAKDLGVKFYTDTKVIDIYNGLKKYKTKIEIYDPIVDKQQALKEYNIKIIKKLSTNYYDSVIIAVAHNSFKKMGIGKIKRVCKKNHIIFDVKNIFPENNTNLKL